MSYTQGTTHYNLPQTLGDDKRDWFDTNQPFADVDAALYSAYEGVQTLDKDLTAVKSDLNTAQTDIASIKQYDAENTVKVSALETLTAQHTVDIEDVRNDAEDMICSVEEKTATAQYEHLTGAYFRYNDTLYVATTDISKGDTIVPNVNCRTTDVSSRITLEKVDISFSSDYFNLLSGVCYRSGNIVQFYLQLQLNQNVSAHASLTCHVLNLPVPLMSASYSVDNTRAGGDVDYLCTLAKGSDIITISPSTDTSAWKNYWCSFTYLCN